MTIADVEGFRFREIECGLQLRGISPKGSWPSKCGGWTILEFWSDGVCYLDLIASCGGRLHSEVECPYKYGHDQQACRNPLRSNVPADLDQIEGCPVGGHSIIGELQPALDGRSILPGA